MTDPEGRSRLGPGVVLRLDGSPRRSATRPRGLGPERRGHRRGGEGRGYRRGCEGGGRGYRRLGGGRGERFADEKVGKRCSV